jgi:hypothetical protein
VVWSNVPNRVSLGTGPTAADHACGASGGNVEPQPLRWDTSEGETHGVAVGGGWGRGGTDVSAPCRGKVWVQSHAHYTWACWVTEASEGAGRQSVGSEAALYVCHAIVLF